jgi:uncharacterized protein (DUF433 family)
MQISDFAFHPPGVETPGYRLKPVETGSRDVAVLGIENLCKRSIWQCAIPLSQHFAIVLLLLSLGIGSLTILQSHPPATSPAPQEQQK